MYVRNIEKCSVRIFERQQGMGGKLNRPRKLKEESDVLSLPPLQYKMLLLFWCQDSPYAAHKISDLVRRIWSLVLRLSPVLKTPRVTKIRSIRHGVGEVFSSTLQLRDDLHCQILGEKGSEPFPYPKICHQSASPEDLVGGPYAVTCAQWQVSFPEPTEIKINMMPFRYHDKTSLPEEYFGYWPLIEACAQLQETPRVDYAQYVDEPKNEIVYLTIDEGAVTSGKSQRRGGIHTDSPGTTYVDDGGLIQYRGAGHWWGQGAFICALDIRGGIFIASNVSDSCRAWNVAVEPEVIGPGGNCEHLRELLEEDMAHECNVIPANQLCWITDKAPHESLPVMGDTHRQFFRLVTGSIGVWYAQHSTPNPLGVVPPTSVSILSQNKFDNL